MYVLPITHVTSLNIRAPPTIILQASSHMMDHHAANGGVSRGNPRTFSTDVIQEHATRMKLNGVLALTLLLAACSAVSAPPLHSRESQNNEQKHLGEWLSS
jgi:hypothetical protein